MSESKKSKQKLLYIGGGICVIVAITAVLCLLFNGKETKISDNGGNSSVSVLDCRVSDPPIEGFFGAKESPAH